MYKVICSNGTPNKSFDILSDAMRYAEDSRKHGDSEISVTKNGILFCRFERHNYKDFGFSYKRTLTSNYWREVCGI